MPGYRVEYASSGRAKCNGRKPCKGEWNTCLTQCQMDAGTSIGKGQLRFGTWVTLHEHGSFKWRHWGCLTSSASPSHVVLKNVSEELEGKISELDGLEELSVGDQSKIKKAFEEVHPDDVPPTAVPEKSAAEDAGSEEEDKATKKRKRAPAKKKTKPNSPQPLDESLSVDRPEEESEEKPAKKS
ncbi:uncharacterized protein VP01_1008g10 [Puccinia sorghi]|uniref:PARP-type domain-containing protein n=1 Tax=Puccinia sorghi TaxID=27349 RepID=A0A0L6VVK0_9BASI|nr:uncharacterized protein VP01_1008g10 [Puccinia sorghi]